MSQSKYITHQSFVDGLSLDLPLASFFKLSTNKYGLSGTKCPKFRSALWFTFLCTQVVVSKTEMSPVQIIILFLLSSLFISKKPETFVRFSWGCVFLSQHNSETALGIPQGYICFSDFDLSKN